MFSDSVENNIRFSEAINESESPEHFRNILHSAAMEEEVGRFPEQEKTMVGAKGIMLSGGQKQRISLARAMLRPCSLLILDNVLSAVDYETERFLLQEIHKLLKPEKGMQALAVSLLIVSHRVTSMEQADWILVLDEGKIVDQGLHTDLIQCSGYYQQMWKLQNENGS